MVGVEPTLSVLPHRDIPEHSVFRPLRRTGERDLRRVDVALAINESHNHRS